MRRKSVANEYGVLLALAFFGFVDLVAAQAPNAHTHQYRAVSHAASAKRAVHHATRRPSIAQRISRISHQAFVAPPVWAQGGGGYTAVGGPARSLPNGCSARACDTRYFGRPEPLGSALHSNMDLQTQNGQRARLVMYEYDFENDPTRDRAALNPAGRRKLERLVPILETTGLPIVIEPSTDYPSISESRRMHVVNVLESELYFSNAIAQVEVKNSPSLGLRGVEAVAIDRSQLNTTRSQGTNFSSSGGSSGFGPSGSLSGSSSGFSN